MDFPSCLPDELIDPLLTTTALVILTRNISDDHVQTSISSVFTILPCHSTPLLTCTILNRYSQWITLDMASALGDVDLLKLLFRLSRTHGRALQYSSDAITLSCKHGHVPTIDWWFESSGLMFYWTADAIDQASAHGHISILDWWAARFRNGQIPASSIKYSTEAINLAIANCHMPVLHWWSTPTSNPFALKVHSMTATIAAVSSLNWDTIGWLESRSLAFYHRRTLGHACRTGDLQMVQHVHNRLQAETMDETIMHQVDLIKWRPVNEDNPFWIASECGHVQVLNWLFDAGYTPNWAGGWRYLDAAVASGDLKVCGWWEEFFRIHVLSDEDLLSALGLACELGHLPLVDWILSKVCDPVLGTSIVLGPSKALFPILPKVCAGGHVAVLDYLNLAVSEARHLSGKQLIMMLNAASMNGHVAILDWIVKHNLLDSDTHFVTQLDVLNLASANGHVPVLQWWSKRYKSPLPYSNRALDLASRKGFIGVLDWWVKQHSGSQLSLKYSSAALHVPCTRQGFATLRWWCRQQQLGNVTLPKLGTRMVHSLMDHGQAALLHALNELKLVPADALDNALDIASFQGHVCILDWLVQIRPKDELHYSDRAMRGASERGFVHILEWWRSRSRLSLKVPSGIEVDSSMNEEVRQWWNASGLCPCNCD